MFKTNIIILSFIVSSLAANSSELPDCISTKSIAPAWVAAIEADLEKVIPSEETSDGVYYLLNDIQVYPEKKSEYVHNVLRLTSTSGVEENSSISVTIDPDYQQLTWHRIDIFREGKRIDQLPKQNFRTSSNQRFDDLTYDNRINCLAIIEGTRKNDIIEYAYSITGQNPVLHERYAGSFSLNYSVPVARISGRIIRNTDSRPLNFKIHSDDNTNLVLSQPKIQDGKNVYHFDLHDVAPVYLDQNIPGNYLAYRYLEVNDWNSWQEVSQWGAALYNYADADVTLTDELQSALVEWRKLNSNEAKVLAALRWVQEEIRYVAIFIGPHNFKPYRLEQTLERGFGDCKDKTQLLCYLLTKMGIDAVPILVNTSSKGLVSEYLPTPSNFDHVITQVNLEGKSYWLDPTYNSQGGSLKNIWHEDYTWGLELSEDAVGLTPVPGQGAEQSKSFMHETFNIKNYHDTISLTVYSRYSGAEADSQRRYFNDVAHQEIEKGYLNYYAQQYPEIQVSQPLKYRDNLANNIVEVNEYYIIPAEWTTDSVGNSMFQLDTYPNMIEQSLSLSDTRIRTMPAAQSYPLDFVQVIEIVLPEPGSFEDERIEIENPWFTYNFTAKNEDRKLILNYAYANRLPSIPAEDYSSYAEKIDAVTDSLGYSITYSEGNEANVATSIFSVEPYPATFLSAILSSLLGLITAGWIVKRKQEDPKPPVDSNLDGISGWLILPAIGIFVSPIILLSTILVDQKDFFHTPWVQEHTIETSSMYIPGFEALLLCEIIFNTFCLILSLTLIYVFIKKRAILPLFYICFSIFYTSGYLVDLLAMNHLLIEAGFDPIEDEWASFSRSVISTVIWSIYFIASDRARSTFRH